MLYYTGLLLLVIAVSMDGLGVGITYGMQKVRVPFAALSIIMICSGMVILLSMTIGTVLEQFLSAAIAKMIGGVILIGIGLFSLVNVIRSQRKSRQEHEPEKPEGTLHDIKTVILTPDRADLDRSGTISIGEAVLLGFALALDAFGAGVGASLLGYSPFVTAIFIATMSGLFLTCGMKIGMLLSKSEKLRRLSFLPPTLLIGLGIINLL